MLPRSATGRSRGHPDHLTAGVVLRRGQGRFGVGAILVVSVAIHAVERLKAHQRTLILAVAEHDGLPAGSAIRAVAELENVIAAVEAVAAEEMDRAKRS